MTTMDAATAYWEAVGVGDPMPPWEEADHRCWALSSPDPVASYICGRAEGHTGQHVAPTAGRIVATWGPS